MITSSKRLVFLERPVIGDEVERAVREGLSQRRTLLLVGGCSVDYNGRASSRLELGERVVMIKEDGSVLVHRPRGYEAVNWQPPGCIFHSRVKDGVLQITAVRRAPAESLRMSFSSLYLVASLKLADEGQFSLHASEEDMQRAVLLMPSLIEEGFKPISYEKKVEPGFVDVYGVDDNGRLVVVEIKRKTAGREAVLQLSRYAKAIEGMASREVRGVLAAPGLAKGTQKLLVSLGLTFKALDPRKCAEVLHKSRTKKLADFL